MTRWKKDQKEFDVNLNDDNAGSTVCRIPKPIIEMFGQPKGVRFLVQGKKIVVITGGRK